MEKRTASDLRAYLSSFEPEYPVKKGYIARLIVNDKLATVDICRKIKGMVQMVEPDKQIHNRRLESAVHDVRRNAAKKVNYTQQWADLVNFHQKPLLISFLSGESLSTSAATSTSVMQPDQTCVPLVQTAHSSAPLIQSDHSQHTSETQDVEELQSNSIHNESLSVPVRPRSPSPRRLRKDCDSCVAKQRTSLNMLKENMHLRLQIRALKVRHREEKKQMSLKILNMTIKKKSESATHWRTKYTNIKKHLKEKELQQRIHEMLITKTFEEEIKALKMTKGT